MKLCKYYNSDMKKLYWQCKALYKLKDCGCGGPLHILLDDGNYEDNHIQFCIEECKKHPNATIAALGTIICREYQKMSMKERAVFDLYLWNRDITCKCDSCVKCPLMLEADNDKESN